MKPGYIAVTQRQRNNGVVQSVSPCPIIFQVEKATGKILASVFWDQDCILIDYLPKGQTINAGYITHLCWCN
jgi:hypothetical protein